MADLTLITHVYNAQQPVDRQLALWQQFSPALRARLQFLVIDDHSDEPLQVDKGELDLRLVRVSDDIDWNMPGCRNLAATLAATPWMLFFDVDNVASEASLQKIVDALPRLDTNRLHVFRRTENGVDVEPHINSFLITRQGFFKGGADHPLSDADLEQKFFANCRHGGVDAPQAQAMLAMLRQTFDAPKVDLSLLALPAATA